MAEYDVDSVINSLAQTLCEVKKIAVLTGAGISVPSGIPDFRSDDGIWTRYPIEDFATVDAFKRDPQKFWTMQHELISEFADCGPNAAHFALCELENLGFDVVVVTQNIDGLHQIAGSSDVIELHGTKQSLSCMECGSRFKLNEIELKPPAAPNCANCGAVIRPDVVYFGEGLPPGAFERAAALAKASEVFLTIGTSAAVSPASYLPEMAYVKGRCLAEFNLERTHLTLGGLVKHFVEGSVDQTLPKLIDRLRELKS